MPRKPHPGLQKRTNEKCLEWRPWAAFLGDSRGRSWKLVGCFVDRGAAWASLEGGGRGSRPGVVLRSEEF